MNIDKIFREEDLFPREFVGFEEREYGILFYDETNKDSYDSNHAVIFKEKITTIVNDAFKQITEKAGKII